MRIGLRGRMVAAGGLVTVIVAGGFVAFLGETEELRDASRVARRSAEATASANRLEGLALNLQTGSEGFAIAGDERFLRPYVHARRALPAQSGELLRLIANPVARAQAAGIIRAVRAYRDDFASVVVETARNDLSRAQSLVAGGAGKARLDSIRAQFERFRRTQRELTAAREQRATAAGEQMERYGLIGLAASVLVIGLFAVYFAGAILSPIRRVARAAGRIAGGDLHARVPASRRDEIGDLGRAFNAMAASLEQNRAELGNRNAALEEALRLLAAEKDRVDSFYEFGELLSAETYSESLAPAILEKLCSLAGAEVGILYAISPDRGHTLELVSTFGIDRSGLPTELTPAAEIKLGAAISARHELQVPLIANGRTVGLLALARLQDRAFTDDDRDTIEHLGAQTAIRIAKRVAYISASKLANINRAVLDAARDGIRMVDNEGNTILTNTAMDRLARGILGLSGAVSVSSLIETFPDRTTDPARYRAATREIAADPERVTLDEYELVSGHWIQRYTAPVRDATGSILGRIFTIGDITAERKAEQLKDEFVASVSHELRTPLTSIRGYLELLLEEEGGRLTPQQRHFLAVVDRNSERLLRLVADLLFVAQVDAGRLPLEHDEVNLALLAHQCVEAARPIAIEKGIDLRLDADLIPVFTGDSARLGQLIDNLVSNALKFTPREGRVDVRVTARTGRALIEIADTGVGIPSADQERLFNRFFRARSAGELAVQGTGLGLSIAKAIAEGHEGTISVESEEGRGTTFRVELPLTGDLRPAEPLSEHMEAV